MPKFTRKIEDFTCEHCGTKVSGDGYTNHCPKCLWSKHVDVYPGDRAAACGGLMQPISVSKEGDVYKVNFKCLTCGYERPNKILSGDNFDEVLKLSSGQLP